MFYQNTKNTYELLGSDLTRGRKYYSPCQFEEPDLHI